MASSERKPEPQPAPAARHTVGELAHHAQALFGVMPETVMGALSCSSMNEWTVPEAKSLIQQFLRKKVI